MAGTVERSETAEEAGKPAAGVGDRGHVAVNFRVSKAMQEAVQVAVSDSPIEFGSVSEFYKRAAEHELRRRGLLKTYK